jgi:hypothetical protein
MKNRLFYENLDTSFVNLAALVRYLRARRFNGSVSVELGEYEGEIILTSENEVQARERDYVSGRVAEGDEAFQRLLIRAREPGGKINVFQMFSEAANTFENKKDAAAISPSGERSENISLEIPRADSARRETFRQPVSLPETTRFAENQFDANKKSLIVAHEQTASEAKPKSLEFPFEFSNKVESKARQIQLSETEREALLHLTAELLQTIDDALAKNNLNFAAAFQKACSETASDYPFLQPNAGIFVYRNGKVEMHEQINPKLFSAGINETLRRILEKLAASPKFAEVYRDTTQKILALVRKNKPLYDEFFITPQLEKILGI